MVCVKNTFLDVKAPAPELRRVVTEPGRAPPDEVEDDRSHGDYCSVAAACGSEACSEAASADEPPDLRPVPEQGATDSSASSQLPIAFCSSGFEQRVIVKNTFLDLDDDNTPATPELRRVQTEPLPRVDLGQFGLQGDDSPRSGAPSDEVEGECYRLISCESVESSRDWDWGSNGRTPQSSKNAGGAQNLVPIREDEDPAAPPAAAVAAVPNAAAPASMPATIVPAPAAMPLGPQAGGIMMVPSTMLMPGVVGMGTIDNLPPGCVAVPVDRFARWPGGPPPVAPPSQAPPVLTRVKSPDVPPLSSPSHGSTAGELGAAPPGPASLPPTPAAPSAPPSPVPTTAPASPVRPPASDQPMLQRAFSVASAIFRVNWTVSARKLKSKDQFAVSPKFELSFKTPCEFKMVIHPTKTSDQKGGKSFVAAKGKGRVELKCETQLDTAAEALMTYRISVGSGDKRLPPRGPVKHNFAESSVSGLASEEEEWDFAAVAEEAQSFVVCLEVLPASAA